MHDFILEIACFSLAGALTAKAFGADRIEYCENPGEGGTTPSFGALHVIREKITIPLFPIIRPRGGDFLYSYDEFSIMKKDVQLCKNLGFDGIVTGILLSNGDIDVKRISQLVELAYPLEVTFHRAFDRCKDPLTNLEQVIDAGCQRILTSGQYPSAIDGIDLIKALLTIADQRIIIMPGSGLNSKNIKPLRIQTGASEFHASARMPIETLMQYAPASMQESLVYMGVDGQEVAALKTALQDRI